MANDSYIPTADVSQQTQPTEQLPQEASQEDMLSRNYFTDSSNNIIQEQAYDPNLEHDSYALRAYSNLAGGAHEATVPEVVSTLAAKTAKEIPASIADIIGVAASITGNDDAAKKLSDFSSGIRESKWGEADQFAIRDKLYQREMAQRRAEIEAQKQADIASGMSLDDANQKAMVAEAGAAIGASFSSGSYLNTAMQGLASLGPSLAVGGAINIGLKGVAATTGMAKLAAKGNSYIKSIEQAAQAAARAGNKAEALKLASRAGTLNRAFEVAKATPSWMAANAVLEGANTHTEMLQELSKHPVTDFINVPEFQQAIEQGYTPEEAKQLAIRSIALSTAEKYGAKAGLVSSLTGGIGARFKGLEGRSLSKNLLAASGDTALEGIEEAAQGYLQTIEQNKALKNSVEPNKNIYEGVGENVALGAIGALGTGAHQVPGAAVTAFKRKNQKTSGNSNSSIMQQASNQGANGVNSVSANGFTKEDNDLISTIQKNSNLNNNEKLAIPLAIKLKKNDFSDPTLVNLLSAPNKDKAEDIAKIVQGKTSYDSLLPALFEHYKNTSSLTDNTAKEDEALTKLGNAITYGFGEIAHHSYAVASKLADSSVEKQEIINRKLSEISTDLDNAQVKFIKDFTQNRDFASNPNNIISQQGVQKVYDNLYNLITKEFPNRPDTINKQIALAKLVASTNGYNMFLNQQPTFDSEIRKFISQSNISSTIQASPSANLSGLPPGLRSLFKRNIENLKNAAEVIKSYEEQLTPVTGDLSKVRQNLFTKDSYLENKKKDIPESVTELINRKHIKYSVKTLYGDLYNAAKSGNKVSATATIQRINDLLRGEINKLFAVEESLRKTSNLEKQSNWSPTNKEDVKKSKSEFITISPSSGQLDTLGGLYVKKWNNSSTFAPEKDITLAIVNDVLALTKLRDSILSNIGKKLTTAIDTNKVARPHTITPNSQIKQYLTNMLGVSTANAIIKEFNSIADSDAVPTPLNLYKHRTKAHQNLFSEGEYTLSKKEQAGEEEEKSPRPTLILTPSPSGTNSDNIVPRQSTQPASTNSTNTIPSSSNNKGNSEGNDNSTPPSTPTPPPAPSTPPPDTPTSGGNSEIPPSSSNDSGAEEIYFEGSSDNSSSEDEEAYFKGLIDNSSTQEKDNSTPIRQVDNFGLDDGTELAESDLGQAINSKLSSTSSEDIDESSAMPEANLFDSLMGFRHTGSTSNSNTNGSINASPAKAINKSNNGNKVRELLDIRGNTLYTLATKLNRQRKAGDTTLYTPLSVLFNIASFKEELDELVPGFTDQYDLQSIQDAIRADFSKEGSITDNNCTMSDVANKFISQLSINLIGEKSTTTIKSTNEEGKPEDTKAETLLTASWAGKYLLNCFSSYLNTIKLTDEQKKNNVTPISLANKDNFIEFARDFYIDVLNKTGKSDSLSLNFLSEIGDISEEDFKILVDNVLITNKKTKKQEVTNPAVFGFRINNKPKLLGVLTKMFRVSPLTNRALFLASLQSLAGLQQQSGRMLDEVELQQSFGIDLNSLSNEEREIIQHGHVGKLFFDTLSKDIAQNLGFSFSDDASLYEKSMLRGLAQITAEAMIECGMLDKSVIVNSQKRNITFYSIKPTKELSKEHPWLANFIANTDTCIEDLNSSNINKDIQIEISNGVDVNGKKTFVRKAKWRHRTYLHSDIEINDEQKEALELSEKQTYSIDPELQPMMDTVANNAKLWSRNGTLNEEGQKAVLSLFGNTEAAKDFDKQHTLSYGAWVSLRGRNLNVTKVFEEYKRNIKMYKRILNTKESEIKEQLSELSSSEAIQKSVDKHLKKISKFQERLALLERVAAINDPTVITKTDLEFLSKKLSNKQMKAVEFFITKYDKKAKDHLNRVIEIEKEVSDRKIDKYGEAHGVPSIGNLLNSADPSEIEKAKEEIRANIKTNLEKQLQNIQNLITEANNGNYSGLGIHYRHGYTNSGRMQMLGGSGPQGNKLARAIWTNVKSNIDLNKPEGMEAFTIAIAQGLGQKVHNLTPFDIINQWSSFIKGNFTGSDFENKSDKVEAYKEFRELVKKFSNDPSMTVNPDTVKVLVDCCNKVNKFGMKGVNIDNSLDGNANGRALQLQCLFYLGKAASYVDSHNGELPSSFENGLYIEADGITDGPMNTKVLFSLDSFGTDYTTNLASGGYFIGNAPMVKVVANSLDSEDYYTKLATMVSATIREAYSTDSEIFTYSIPDYLNSEARAKYANEHVPESMDICKDFFTIMHTVSSEDYTEPEGQEGTGLFTKLARSIIKKPATQWNYQAGGRSATLGLFSGQGGKTFYTFIDKGMSNLSKMDYYLYAAKWGLAIEDGSGKQVKANSNIAKLLASSPDIANKLKARIQKAAFMDYDKTTEVLEKYSKNTTLTEELKNDICAELKPYIDSFDIFSTPLTNFTKFSFEEVKGKKVIEINNNNKKVKTKTGFIQWSILDEAEKSKAIKDEFNNARHIKNAKQRLEYQELLAKSKNYILNPDVQEQFAEIGVKVFGKIGQNCYRRLQGEETSQGISLLTATGDFLNTLCQGTYKLKCDQKSQEKIEEKGLDDELTKERLDAVRFLLNPIKYKEALIHNDNGRKLYRALSTAITKIPTTYEDKDGNEISKERDYTFVSYSTVKQLSNPEGDGYVQADNLNYERIAEILDSMKNSPEKTNLLSTIDAIPYKGSETGNKARGAKIATLFRYYYAKLYTVGSLSNNDLRDIKEDLKPFMPDLQVESIDNTGKVDRSNLASCLLCKFENAGVTSPKSIADMSYVAAGDKRPTFPETDKDKYIITRGGRSTKPDQTKRAFENLQRYPKNLIGITGTYNSQEYGISSVYDSNEIVGNPIAYIDMPTLTGVRNTVLLAIMYGDGRMAREVMQKCADMGIEIGQIFDGMNLPLNKARELNKIVNAAAQNVSKVRLFSSLYKLVKQLEHNYNNAGAFQEDINNMLLRLQMQFQKFTSTNVTDSVKSSLYNKENASGIITTPLDAVTDDGILSLRSSLDSIEQGVSTLGYATPVIQDTVKQRIQKEYLKNSLIRKRESKQKNEDVEDVDDSNEFITLASSSLNIGKTFDTLSRQIRAAAVKENARIMVFRKFGFQSDHMGSQQQTSKLAGEDPNAVFDIMGNPVTGLSDNDIAQSINNNSTKQVISDDQKALLRKYNEERDANTMAVQELAQNFGTLIEDYAAEHYKDGMTEEEIKNLYLEANNKINDPRAKAASSTYIGILTTVDLGDTNVVTKDDIINFRKNLYQVLSSTVDSSNITGSVTHLGNNVIDTIIKDTDIPQEAKAFLIALREHHINTPIHRYASESSYINKLKALGVNDNLIKGSLAMTVYEPSTEIYLSPDATTADLVHELVHVATKNAIDTYLTDRLELKPEANKLPDNVKKALFAAEDFYNACIKLRRDINNTDSKLYRNLTTEMKNPNVIKDINTSLDYVFNKNINKTEKGQLIELLAYMTNQDSLRLVANHAKLSDIFVKIDEETGEEKVIIPRTVLEFCKCVRRAFSLIMNILGIPTKTTVSTLLDLQQSLSTVLLNCPITTAINSKATPSRIIANASINLNESPTNKLQESLDELITKSDINITPNTDRKDAYDNLQKLITNASSNKNVYNQDLLHNNKLGDTSAKTLTDMEKHIKAVTSTLDIINDPIQTAAFSAFTYQFNAILPHGTSEYAMLSDMYLKLVDNLSEENNNDPEVRALLSLGEFNAQFGDIKARSNHIENLVAATAAAPRKVDDILSRIKIKDKSLTPDIISQQVRKVFNLGQETMNNVLVKVNGKEVSSRSLATLQQGMLSTSGYLTEKTYAGSYYKTRNRLNDFIVDSLQKVIDFIYDNTISLNKQLHLYDSFNKLKNYNFDEFKNKGAIVNITETTLNTIKAGVMFLPIITGAFSKKHHKEVCESIYTLCSKLDVNGVTKFIRDIILCINGYLDKDADIFTHLNKVKQITEGERELSILLTPTVLRESFNSLSKEEDKLLLTTVGKFGFHNFIGDNSIDLKKALIDSSYRNQQIQDIKNRLSQLTKNKYSFNSNKYLNELDLLAQRLADPSRVKGIAPGNTIGALATSNKQFLLSYGSTDEELTEYCINSIKDSNGIIHLADLYVSMKALELANNTAKENLVKLVNREWNGISSSLVFEQGTHLSKLDSPNINFNMLSSFDMGYLNIRPTKRSTTVFSQSLKETEAYLSKGYTIVKEWKNKNDTADITDTTPKYYQALLVAPFEEQSKYNSGAIRYTRATLKNVNDAGNFINGGYISLSDDSTAPTDKATYTTMTEELIRQLKELNLTVIPKTVFTIKTEKTKDEFGNSVTVDHPFISTVGYQIDIDKNLVDSNVKFDWSYLTSIGREYSRYNEEGIATGFNHKLLNMLFNKIESNSKLNLKYVTPFIYDSKNKKYTGTTSRYNEIWNKLPKDIKQRIIAFGVDKFKIDSNLIDTVFGYRSVSIRNLIRDKNSREALSLVKAFCSPQLYSWLVRAEDFMQDLTKYTKRVVVINSFIVPVSNAISNGYSLMLRGVPLPIILKRAPFYMQLTEQYTKARTIRTKLLLQKQATNDPIKIAHIEDRLKSVNNIMNSSKIKPLIDAGELNAIEDLGEIDIDEQLFQGKIMDWVRTNINEKVRNNTVTKNALVTKDTDLYKIMLKTAQYGDFIAKAILYEYYTEGTEESRRMSPKDALQKIQNEFVNYNIPKSATRQYLEDMGLLWFSEYSTKICQTMASIIRDNPLMVLMGYGVDAALPDVLSNIGSTPLSANIYAKICKGSMDSLIGPDNYANMITMNPSVELLSSIF